MEAEQAKLNQIKAKIIVATSPDSALPSSSCSPVSGCRSPKPFDEKSVAVLTPENFSPDHCSSENENEDEVLESNTGSLSFLAKLSLEKNGSLGSFGSLGSLIANNILSGESGSLSFISPLKKISGLPQSNLLPIPTSTSASTSAAPLAPASTLTTSSAAPSSKTTLNSAPSTESNHSVLLLSSVEPLLAPSAQQHNAPLDQPLCSLQVPDSALQPLLPQDVGHLKPHGSNLVFGLDFLNESIRDSFLQPSSETEPLDLTSRPQASLDSVPLTKGAPASQIIIGKDQIDFKYLEDIETHFSSIQQSSSAPSTSASLSRPLKRTSTDAPPEEQPTKRFSPELDTSIVEIPVPIPQEGLPSSFLINQSQIIPVSMPEKIEKIQIQVSPEPRPSSSTLAPTVSPSRVFNKPARSKPVDGVVVPEYQEIKLKDGTTVFVSVAAVEGHELICREEGCRLLKFLNKYTLTKHIRTFHDPYYKMVSQFIRKCNFCGYESKIRRNLQQHYCASKSRRYEYKCLVDGCDDTYRYMNGWLIHLREAHGITPDHETYIKASKEPLPSDMEVQPFKKAPRNMGTFRNTRIYAKTSTRIRKKVPFSYANEATYFFPPEPAATSTGGATQITQPQ